MRKMTIIPRESESKLQCKIVCSVGKQMENEQNTMQKNVENALSVWIMDILITY